MKKSINKSSIQIQYKGCFYHSLLELKFVLLIEDRCSWIREPIAIHYNPDTLEIANYINENTKKHIPDFLVRKWIDNSAFLIEIKPKFFLESEQMRIRKTVINNYLKNKDLDWKYKVITEDDIKLDERKNELFKKIVRENKNFKCKLALIKRDKKVNNVALQYFNNIPHLNSEMITKDDYKRYVKYGILPLSSENVDVFPEEH